MGLRRQHESPYRPEEADDGEGESRRVEDRQIAIASTVAVVVAVETEAAAIATGSPPGAEAGSEEDSLFRGGGQTCRIGHLST